MSPPPGWRNPIQAAVGQIQRGIDPLLLLPSCPDLVRTRLDFQRRLILAGIPRLTPVRVTTAGVIYDGHHAIRAAAEEQRTVDVVVVDQPVQASATSILHLPVG